MAFDLEEQEQIETLKAFWARWGVFIKSVIALSLLALVAWKGYEFYQSKQSEKAQVAYDLFDAAQQKKDAGAANLLANLQKDHPKTRFAALASLDVAAAAMTEQKWDQAVVSLQWVVENGLPENQGVARLQLADVMVQLGKSDEAIKVLSILPNPSFTAAFANKSADVHLMMKDSVKARAAMEEALKAVQASEIKNEQLETMIKMKLDLLPN